MAAVINIIPMIVPIPKINRYPIACRDPEIVVRTNNATAADPAKP